MNDITIYTLYGVGALGWCGFIFSKAWDIMYKWRKKMRKGAWIRVFMFGKNGNLTSDLVNVGSKYGSTIDIGGDRTHVYNPAMVRSLPKGLGRISGEPCLWYVDSRIEPIDPIMLSKTGSIGVTKTPQEFRSALNSKIFIEAFEGPQMDKKAIGIIGVLIFAGIAFGLLKHFGVV